MAQFLNGLIPQWVSVYIYNRCGRFLCTIIYRCGTGRGGRVFCVSLVGWMQKVTYILSVFWLSPEAENLNSDC